MVNKYMAVHNVISRRNVADFPWLKKKSVKKKKKIIHNLYKMQTKPKKN